MLYMGVGVFCFVMRLCAGAHWPAPTESTGFFRGGVAGCWGSRDEGEEEVGGEEDEVDGALHHGGSAGGEGDGADEEGEGEEGDVLGVEAEGEGEFEDQGGED